MDLRKEFFGKTLSGRSVDLYTLSNSRITIKITNFGGIITSILVPDQFGKLDDVVLGFDSLEGYSKPHPYFGAIIGRYANRIQKGKFKLDDVEYNLAVNNDANSLHGGLEGFDKVIWQAKEKRLDAGSSLELSYYSKDGEEGYPGNLDVKVTYCLTENDELIIDYFAITDKKTIVNLTNHSYFNLAGRGKILDHLVTIFANQFTPIGEDLIPTGELKDVANTPFDFQTPRAIGERINSDDLQLQYARGYDHNFVLESKSESLTLAARVEELDSGRIMEVLTTKPGVHFYSGNFLDGTIQGKKGEVYDHNSGFCLETQYFPDSPNQTHFPSPILYPEKNYQARTVFRFLTKSTLFL